MLWVYVLLTTAGVVAIVPTIIRAIDDKPSDLITGLVGFVGFFGGLTGLFCRQAGIGGWATLVAAAAVGLAAGALHPELLALLQPGAGGDSDDRHDATERTESMPARRTPTSGLRHKKNAELTHDD